MSWLKSHKRLLGIVAALVLVVVAAGFALTRGYLIHFVLRRPDHLARGVLQQRLRPA